MRIHVSIVGVIALILSAGPTFAAADSNSGGGLETTDGASSFRLGGEVMLDFVEPFSDIEPMGQNLSFSRARLAFEGTLHDDWRFRIEYDFAENFPDAKDLFARYTGFSRQEFLIGQFKQPWSLEELSADDQMAFLERSLMNGAWSTAYRTGLAWRQFGARHSFMASVYGKESGLTTTGGLDEPISYGVRMVWTPINGDHGLLHLGVAAAHEQIAFHFTEFGEPEGDGARLRARPEARTSGDVRLIDTGFIDDATGLSKTGFEAAWMSGGLSVQAEYQVVGVDSQSERDPTFSGYYVEARWFPGGEVRPYDMRTGTFSMIRPSSVDGAWEFKLRLSHLDLEDGCVSPVIAPPCALPANSGAGVESNTSLGIGRYSNSNIRWMLEYVLADVTSINPLHTQSPSFLQGRVQLVW